jgi:hypothetical protein
MINLLSIFALRFFLGCVVPGSADPFVDGPSRRLFVQERALDGADGFIFEEFGVGSDTEGFQHACLHLP